MNKSSNENTILRKNKNKKKIAWTKLLENKKKKKKNSMNQALRKNINK